MASSARQLLERARPLDDVDAAELVARLREELPADDAGTEAAVRDVLAAIDDLARRGMRHHLDHLVAGGAPILPPFRRYLGTEVTSYAADLETLRARVTAATDAACARAVVDAATSVLAVRTRLRDAVRAMVDAVVAARAADAEARAKAAAAEPPSREELIELD